MLIGGLQKCTLVDVPGKVAATIFTMGCPFRCLYCHNPELVIPSQFNTPIACADVLDFLKSRIGKLQALCISGGEPTVHKGLGAFIKQVKDLGYFVKLDSSGIFPERLASILSEGNVDYIAMDIKGPLEKYASVAKIQNSEPQIAKSIKLIMNSGIDYEFRTTVCKPLLSVDDFHAMGQLIVGARRHFIQNYVKASKQVDAAAKLQPFCDQELEQAQKIMSKYVGSVGIR